MLLLCSHCSHCSSLPLARLLRVSRGLTRLIAAAATAAALGACGVDDDGDDGDDDDSDADSEGEGGEGEGEPPNDVARFLVRDGVGTESDTLAYYGALEAPVDDDGVVAAVDVGVLTIAEWMRVVFGQRERVNAFYRNTADLGFWREMSCTQEIGRGVGGCAVRNWRNVDDKDAGGSDLGTVAMRIDGEGRVQFYAFAPGGALSTFVVLDDEGEKFLPMACTVCHGGEARIGEPGGLGAVFREFEPSMFELPPGADDGELQERFARLNRIVALANESVKREDEGAPFGSDHAALALNTYLEEMYAGAPLNHARSVHDPAHLPDSWRAPVGTDGVAVDAQELEARRALWTDVVNPYCMGCHRTSSSYDFHDYDLFATLREVKDGVPELRRLFDLGEGGAGIVMPQSQLLWNNLAADVAAQDAIERWLAGGAADNSAPVVVVSPTQARVAAGDTVAFDASASFDADGDSLSFQWTQLSGPQLALVDGADSALVVVTAPVDAPGASITLAVSVDDGRGLASEDVVLLTIDDVTPPPNSAPVAVLDVTTPATPTARAGSIVSASAAASSDADGDALTFLWTLPTASSPLSESALFPTNAGEQVFVLLPPQLATLELAVAVDDGRGGSDTAVAAVAVAPFDPATGVVVVAQPALAIPDDDPAGVVSALSVETSDTATIAALRVPVLVKHTFVGDLRVVLRGPGGFEAVLHNHSGGSADDIAQVFDVPTAAGRAALGAWELSVVDDVGADVGVLAAWGLDVDIVDVPPPPPNQPPVAVAGAGVSAQIGDVVVLDGTGSSDPDGDALTFVWSQTTGPQTIALTPLDDGAPAGARVQWTAPSSAGLYRFRLVIDDGKGLSAAADVDVTVSELPPVGTVKIVELLVNPAGIDSGLEWIKLRNDSNVTVDLAQHALAFGGNVQWGNTSGGNGGVLALSGTLAPGECKLVAGGLSTPENASPDLANAVVVNMAGNGLQNPNQVPDAVAFFASPASAVNASSIPVDAVVYGRTGAVSPSPFIGPAGAPAAIDLIVSGDAIGRSFKRSSTGWRQSGAIGATDAPAPNACEAP